MALPIRTILVATDLSDASDEVLRSAARIAAVAGAELHLIHAKEPTSDLPGMRETALEMQSRMHDSRDRINEQLERTSTADRIATARLLFDSPHRAIQERARQVGADLIVIGPNRDRSLGARVLGSTADRLIRITDVPCLIVRAPVNLPLRQVLVPTDLSRTAQLAISEAFTWATALGLPSDPGEGEPAEVTALHVVPRGSAVNLTVDGRDWFEHEVHQQVALASRELPADSSLGLKEQVIHAALPADEILRLSAEGIDLIVLGTHGRGALRRALIGSVTSTVARQAACPVLLVPPVFEAAPPRRPAESEDIREVAAVAEV